MLNSSGEYRRSPAARATKDVAGPGKFDLNRAFFRSSNTYFIHFGMKAGLRKLLDVAKRFHLGEKTDFLTRAEKAGISLHRMRPGKPLIQHAVRGHRPGNTPTPLQMAALIGAIANGGKIFWPRLVSHSHSPETGIKNNFFRRDACATVWRFIPDTWNSPPRHAQRHRAPGRQHRRGRARLIKSFISQTENQAARFPGRRQDGHSRSEVFVSQFPQENHLV